MKRTASLSLDLDNLWSYLKTHGDAGWDSYPTYLPLVVPRVLEFLKVHDLKITFFIVGQDAADPQHHSILKSISDAGHEIGNHSFHHEQWLHLYTESQIEDELARTEEILEKVTGQRTTGFRGPGFSCSATLLKVLARRNYQYDCSTFPTFLGPLARMFYFATAKGLSPEEMKQRARLFGKLSEGFRPLKPYQWETEAGKLLEIPVTTLPLFKVPLHASYVLYLSQFSRFAAKRYWNMALRMCRWSGTELSLLLHPLDFLGCDDTDRLSFFPAMKKPAQPKIEMMHYIIKQMKKSFNIIPMGEHASQYADRKLSIRTPKFD
jgi:peptidoglycan-N-acetylglucosamine deacetylase